MSINNTVTVSFVDFDPPDILDTEHVIRNSGDTGPTQGPPVNTTTYCSTFPRRTNSILFEHDITKDFTTKEFYNQ